MKAKVLRKGKGKAGKQTNRDKLQKFKDAVNDFVKSKGGFGENGSDQRGVFAKKKSRKELRKEKRKLKKAKNKSHYMGQSVQNPSEEPAPNTPAEEEKTQKPALKGTGHLKNTAQKQQNTNKDSVNTKDYEEETTKRKVHFSEDLPKQINKSSLKESRKRSLLEANIEEDKEIKRLEKRLGLNKRKNKKSMPQSFTDDGLDYILGILEPGASAAGLYESDEEMDIDKAKDDFDVLDKDSDGPESDDENEDDSKDEGDTDEEEGDGEDEAQMEEEDVEDNNQIEDEVEGDQEEEDTDASEEKDDGEKVDSEQKTAESQEPVCHSKSGYYILLLFKFKSP